jgi:hypothetical protein
LARFLRGVIHITTSIDVNEAGRTGFMASEHASPRS